MSTERPGIDELRDEDRRVRHLRMLVDLTANLIMQGSLTRPEAEELSQALRRRALELFPGREETYEIVYAPRFRRLLDEFAPRTPSAAGGHGPADPGSIDHLFRTH